MFGLRGVKCECTYRIHSYTAQNCSVNMAWIYSENYYVGNSVGSLCILEFKLQD
jgi:hypothetical protein